jgi:hypothetical protein
MIRSGVHPSDGAGGPVVDSWGRRAAFFFSHTTGLPPFWRRVDIAVEAARCARLDTTACPRGLRNHDITSHHQQLGTPGQDRREKVICKTAFVISASEPKEVKEDPSQGGGAAERAQRFHRDETVHYRSSRRGCRSAHAGEPDDVAEPFEHCTAVLVHRRTTAAGAQPRLQQEVASASTTKGIEGRLGPLPPMEISVRRRGFSDGRPQRGQRRTPLRPSAEHHIRFDGRDLRCQGQGHRGMNRHVSSARTMHLLRSIAARADPSTPAACTRNAAQDVADRREPCEQSRLPRGPSPPRGSHCITGRLQS